MGVKRETEASFMRAVMQAAKLHGWECWHDVDSRKNAAGLPDLILLRGGVCIFAELKTDAGRLRPAQARYQELLAAVEAKAGGAVRVFVWRPSQWASIVKTLTEEGRE